MIEIKKMLPKHLKEVLKIESLSFPLPWSEQSFYYEIVNNPYGYYVVATDQDKVVGYGGMWILIDECHITTIAVDPKRRGEGIGRKILEHLIEKAKENDLDWISLEVRITNTVAQKLYKSLGFEVVGIRKGYYLPNNEDAIIMRLMLRGEKGNVYYGDRHIL
jgi:ribosomal-protein-alanine N-acetyltransferase